MPSTNQLQKLSPSQRTLRARVAAHTLHSKVDSKKHTEPARLASPGNIAYWQNDVDPENKLSPRERTRRAESAKKAHFTSLSFKAARARSQKRTA